MSPPRPLAVLLILLGHLAAAGAVEIIAKSRVERCARDSGTGDRLSCEQKLVVDLAVPSGASGGEDSLVAHINEANNTESSAIRDPPTITINKSAIYAAYDLTYLRDVAYKPEEQYVETRKCEPDAGADIVKSCERLRNASGSVIEYTEPVCCPCGQHRVRTSCGNFFDKIVKGKRNTAHCVRFPGDWFHVFEIGTMSLGFSIRVQVKKGSSVSEVVIGPDNRTVVSGDNFLRVNLLGDFAGYTRIPTFENLYLVTPRKGDGSGQPQDIGDQYSRWMLLEKFYFTHNGLECNKIGVGYQAYQNQPDFCSSPMGSCLYSQLWNFIEDDKNRVNKNLTPEHVVVGRFERINQHPNAGAYSFSIGVTNIHVTNLLVELSADDIQYVYQRSPGEIISIQVPTFEALSQVGVANVTAKNTGELEASYGLTFKCTSGINLVEEQFFIMKPGEATTRQFYLHTSTEQATSHQCEVILKASNFSVADSAKCQFSTTPTVLNNGTQIGRTKEQKKDMGFFESIKAFFVWIGDSVAAFFTGRWCRTKCSSIFDLSCYLQYMCLGGAAMSVGLFLFIILPVAVLLWFMHQKGFFDYFYDWLKDLLGLESRDGDHRRRHHRHSHRHGDHPRRHHHAHQGHRSEPGHHHHHRVLHNHDEQQPDAAAGGHRHRHMDEHQHRHGKSAAALHLDGSSQQASSWLQETDDWERRHPERYDRHGRYQ